MNKEIPHTKSYIYRTKVFYIMEQDIMNKAIQKLPFALLLLMKTKKKILRINLFFFQILITFLEISKIKIIIVNKYLFYCFQKL